MSCTFCDIVAGTSPATVVARWPGVLAIRPRRPHVPGHTLVIPETHVADVAESSAVSALVMSAAAELAGRHPASNVLTSRGEQATQSVFHLHVHVVPRDDGDGLPPGWPWRLESRPIRET
jgi:histidine triad (HIT) family protein